MPGLYHLRAAAAKATLFIVLPLVALALVTLSLVALPRVALADDPSDEFATPPLVTHVAPRNLREILATVQEQYPLRVTLATRETIEGHPWRVYGDTLLLVAPADYRRDGATAGATARLRAPVADIVRVQQKRSGASGGASWGAKSGAAVGGGLGVLLGVVIAALGDGDDSVAGPIMMVTAMGAASGAVLGTGLGAGFGAMTHDWRQLWPITDEGDEMVSDGSIRRTRLCLEGGWSFDTDAVVDGHGLGGRLGILRRLGDWVEMGPCVEYHDIRGQVEFDDDNYYYDYGPYRYTTDRMFALGLDVRANNAAAGLRPFGATGVGWCVAGDLYLGAHLGAGVRWRGESGHEFSLAARRFFALTGTDAQRGQFWALSVGITYGH